MLHLTHRRAVRALAVALPVAAGASLFTVIGGASAAPRPSAPLPAPRPPSAAPAASGVALAPRTITLPMKTAAGTRAPRVLAAAAPALPTFSGRFVTAGKTYHYTMIGSDPSQAATTTTARNTLVPVALKFGRTVVGPSSTTVTSITRSALFKSATFPGGTGQYGDVYMRTQFWSLMNKGRKAWHVTMARPSVAKAVTFSVPTGKGGTARTKTGATVHLVDVAWFDAQVQPLVAAASPDALTQFLAGEVVLCGRVTRLSTCGIGGYHSATKRSDGIRTYTVQAYLSARVFGAKSAFYGLAPMSHELAEWLTDPYLGNIVPRWTQPSVPQYGCSSLLEVGDPLVGHVLALGSVIVQDEAYLPFFSRRKPSTWNGRYSWFGSQKVPSKSC